MRRENIQPSLIIDKCLSELLNYSATGFDTDVLFKFIQHNVDGNGNAAAFGILMNDF
jgi:hypothetical protein